MWEWLSAEFVHVTCLSHVVEIAIERANMDRLRNGWFTEECEIWAGQKLSLKVKEVLHHEKTLYQDILIFQRYVKYCSLMLSC